jgi:hypothetical protein
MIDSEAAKDAIGALAVAMAAILEDALDRAVTTRPAFTDYIHTARRVRDAGADVGVLASAMEIITRRAEPAE